jgi:phosphate transport system substrate-binding protein
LSAPRGGAGQQQGLRRAHALPRTYPLFNEQHFDGNVKPGTKMDPLAREFMRYVLSQEGQAEIVRDGKYLPLTAQVVREQLRKLDQ